VGDKKMKDFFGRFFSSITSNTKTLLEIVLGGLFWILILCAAYLIVDLAPKIVIELILAILDFVAKIFN
jgi:hypothetical protein